MGPGSHVGFPISAKNKNLVYDHPMNISASQFKANMAWMVLRWSTSKIVFSDPDLGSKWPPSANIVLT
jgi:hypothetical protein